MLEPTFRPIISVIRVTPDRSSVEVALDLDGRQATGYAEIADDDSTRAACLGTIAAVQGLLPESLQLSLEWVDVIDRDADTALVNAAVRLRTTGGADDEVLLGAALVRGDADVAAVRATLDGLTRRLVAHLFD